MGTTAENLRKRARADLDAKLETQRQIIKAAQSAACGWASFYIKDRLEELETLFPGHDFTYTHQIYGTGLTVAPPLHSRRDLDDLDGDLETGEQKRFKGSNRLREIVSEISDLAVTIEDEFHMNPGRITTGDDLEEAT